MNVPLTDLELPVPAPLAATLAAGAAPSAPVSAPRRRGLSLLQKGLLIIFIPLLFQGALLALLFEQQRQQQMAQEWAMHTKDVLHSLDEILEALLIVQSDLRGQLLGLPTETEHVGAADAGLPRQVDQLIRLVADNPPQVARGRAIGHLIEQRRQFTREITAKIARGELAEAQAEFRAGDGAALMRSIREAMGTFRGEEEVLDQRRLQALAHSTQFFRIVLIGGLVLDLLIAGTAMWFAARNIGRRMRLLTDNVNRLKTGETLLPPTEDFDELGDLDRSFHGMAAELRAAEGKERQFKQTVEQHNAELTRANHELKQKNQENEMFVYSVSHDLRSPLVNLQGFSKELGMVRNDLRELFSTPMTEPERARGLRLVERDISEPISYIQTAVTRLSSIIDALLRLSRAGRVEYLPVRVDLAPVLQRIIDALRGTMAQKQATITVQPELPETWGDRTAVEQIFANLLINAVNYLDTSRPGEIEVGARADGSAGTTYYVKDNGLGIAAAHLPKLFAAFQRLHEKVAPGEGVGLALVRRVVERHGGKIWAESEENVGTTFFVHLPPEAESPLQIAPKKESLGVHLQARSAELASGKLTELP